MALAVSLKENNWFFVTDKIHAQNATFQTAEIEM
jgi:hypothetical protein